MKKIIGFIISLLFLQSIIVYGETASWENMDAVWANEGVAMWKLPEEEQKEDVVTYYLKLYKDDVLTTEQAINILKEDYHYDSNYVRKRGSYNFEDVMKDKGEGVYTFSVSSEKDKTEIYSPEYFYYGEKIFGSGDFYYEKVKYSESSSAENVYASFFNLTIPHYWVYTEKENSKFEVSEINHYYEYYEDLEYDKFMAGDVNETQYKFTPKEPGEETIVFRYIDMDSKSIGMKSIVLKYKIDENLKATFIGAEEKIPMFGDADADGILTAADAAIILKKSLNSNFVVPAEKLYGNLAFELLDVDGKGSIGANDAALVLNKVLNGNEKFEAEK